MSTLADCGLHTLARMIAPCANRVNPVPLTAPGDARSSQRSYTMSALEISPITNSGDILDVVLDGTHVGCVGTCDMPDGMWFASSGDDVPVWLGPADGFDSQDAAVQVVLDYAANKL